MNFSEFDLSILGEIGNVSVGGAATSLSDFVNKLVTISIPDTKISKFEEIKSAFEPAVVFAKIGYSQGFTGSNIMLMRKEEALDFVKIIVREKLGKEIEEWDDFARNVLAEIFNIMVGNMSSSMSDIFNKDIKIETPQIFEENADDLDFYGKDDVLIAVWFEMRLEDSFKLKLVQLITEDQAKLMVDLIKGDYEL